MKILWVVSSLLPQIARLTGEPEQPFGGWLVSTLDGLLKDPQNSVFVCYRASGPQRRGESGRLAYCSFAQDTLEYSKENDALFFELLNQVQPDVVHIWGTEYPSALAMIQAAERQHRLDHTVVSIQGLTSVYSRHYTAGLPHRVVAGSTLRDFLRRDNIAQQQQKFARRGGFEKMALRKARHVIGRTRWDKACVRQVNPNAVYHVCNESLREPFYEGSWAVSNCERHTIFVSQGDYPIKGLHEALSALAYVLKDYPDAKLLTTGNDPRGAGIRKRLFRSSYAAYLTRLSRQLGLDDHVVFLGFLPADEMKRRYCSAHVALNPSSIENSSNAIGEAMLLGTPVVASYVGGTPDLVTDGVSGLLYPFGAPDLLADAVRRVFSDDALATRLSNEARRVAAARHSREQNLTNLMAIYRDLAAAPERE